MLIYNYLSIRKYWVLFIMGNQKKVFLVVLLLATFGVVSLIRDYFGVIALTILIVLMFNPIYKRFLYVFRGNKAHATTLVLLVIFLSMVIPVLALVSITAYQITEVAKDLENANFSRSDLGKVTNYAIESVNTFLRQNSINYQITSDQFNNVLNEGLKSGGTFLLNFVGNIGGKLPQFVTDIILLIIFLTFLFPNQDIIIKNIRKMSPLSDEITNIYLSRVAAMARSMVNGTFVVAFVQAVIGGITLWLVGVPYPLFFSFILLVVSVIPILGSGLILVPTGIVLIITGKIAEGIIILLVQFVIVSNIDNILRPKLVESDVKIPEALTLLGIVSGLSLFGILGLIFGPVIMIIAYTTYDIYLKYYAISVKSYLSRG